MTREEEAKNLLTKMGYKVIKESEENQKEKLEKVFDLMTIEEEIPDRRVNELLDTIDEECPNWKNMEAEEIYEVLRENLYNENKKNTVSNKVINEALEDIEDEELKSAVEELAEYTNNDVEDVEINENTDNTIVTFGSEEYYLFDSYEAAEEAAKESVINLIDDCGGVLKSGIHFENLGGIEQYLDEDDALSIIEETERNMLEELDEEELEEQYGTTDIDEALEVLIKDSVAGDPIGYIQDQWGKEELQVLIDNGAINFNEKELAEDVVNADGLANSLASYDGEEIELGNGYYAYRIN